jgi:carboxypeptidase Taq
MLLMTPDDAYAQLTAELKDIALLGTIGSVLGWDEHTYLPPRATDHRAAQATLLAGMVHDRFTSSKVGELLAAVEASGPTGDAAIVAREVRRDYDRATKLPASLVEEQTRTAVLAHAAWAEARAASDFAAFAPWLVKTLDLKRQEIAAVGYKDHPYDALLDEYEPGLTTADVRWMFDGLRGPLVDLIGRIGAAATQAPAEILDRHYPAGAQEQLARAAAAAIGFDFNAGRLDVSVHPFCADLGPGDIRLTTRYDDHYFGDAFFGVLHEAGHGMYEQGLPMTAFGSPLGQAVSHGVHESQSRLWENFVGRGRPFWAHFLPAARAAFPAALAGVSDDDWHRAINAVGPSLIRTDADETTYNLHVLLRFELEVALIAGELSVTDLPAAWDERMRQYLGLTPPDAARGVLQDVHWSHGSFGYFPTYTLGNLYAAQLFDAATANLGDVDGQFARGEFAPLLGWLREHVHRHGRRYPAAELVQRATGKAPSAEPLLRHLRSRAAEVYGVS